MAEIIKLFDDQKAWMRSTVDSFERPQPTGEGPFQRVLSVAGTGFGKTTVASVAAWYCRKKWQPGRSLFLADTDELVGQAIKEIKKATGIIADREQGKHRASLLSEVVVGSIQTMTNGGRFERWPANHFGLVTADEAHLSMADGWQTVLNHFDGGGARSLGITATPMRGDKRDLWSWWQHLGANIGLFELIALGRLAPITVKTLPLEIDMRGIPVNDEGEFDEKQMSHVIEKSFDAVIAAFKEHGENRKTLWFLPGRDASRKFAAKLNAAGLSAMHVDGKTKGRTELLQRFEENQFRHLCNANLLMKGYNCPDIDCVVILKLTESPVAYQQMIGRGTRMFPGKTDLLVLDFLWKFDKLGVQRPTSLVARTAGEAERMQRAAEARGIDATDLRNVRELAEIESVRGLVADLLKRTGASGRQYDAREAAAVLNAPALLEYEPTDRWETLAPTPAQLASLVRDGIDPSTITSRGQATSLITHMMNRRAADNSRLATIPQIVELMRLGVKNPEQLPRREAEALLSTSPTR